jgi:hypothetical protein
MLLSRNQNYYSYNNSNRYVPPPTHTRFPQSRKEYRRALKNIENFRNLNRNNNTKVNDIRWQIGFISQIKPY